MPSVYLEKILNQYFLFLSFARSSQLEESIAINFYRLIILLIEFHTLMISLLMNGTKKCEKIFINFASISRT